MKNILTTFGASILIATTGVYASDIKPLSMNEIHVGDLPVVALKATNSAPVADVVVFYQPSYMAKYGEYEAFRRIEEWFKTANKSYAAHGLNYQLSIKDIVPVESVTDDIPYANVEDENDTIIQNGATYIFSVAVLNAGKPEYGLYQTKWKADLVVYVRERRKGDKSLGAAGLGGEYAIVLDNDTDPKAYTTLAHEIGHSLGMNHEKAKASVGPDYGRAWQCGGKSTIMYSSASEKATLHHYSSPYLSFGEETCGDEDVANNARILQENFIKTTQRRNGVESLGQVSFSSKVFKGNESDGVKISLVRDGDLSQKASVKVFVENGSAVWGEDFTDSFVLAEFEAKQATVEVVLPMVNDVDKEGDETASVFMQYPYKLTPDDDARANIIIEDGSNSGLAGQFSISSSASTVDEGGILEFTVTRTGGVGEVLIHAVDKNETAKAGNDFVELNESLLFAEGDVEKKFSLKTVNDEIYEESETMTVSISSSSTSVEYLEQDVQISILDNDVYQPKAGGFSLFVVSKKVNEDIGSFTVGVNRVNGSDGELKVRIFTSDNGQVSGKDYKAIDQVLVFSDGETKKEVKVTVIDEQVNDDDTGFTINLEAKGVEISESPLTITIKDNDNPNSKIKKKTSSFGGSMGTASLILFSLVGFLRRKVFVNLH
ncbi:MAG: hypothetical protein HRT37_15380 [Alteromonadaceae bacterium]|nr:hypothetical protein [Alteromonadaceae bacterium]